MRIAPTTIGATSLLFLLFLHAVVGQFPPPAPPCSFTTAQKGPLIIPSIVVGPLASTNEAGSRNVIMGGAANHIGDDTLAVVNSFMTGANGSVRYSNSALFAYANRHAATHRNNEFRVHAINGAAFEGTEVRAAGLLVRDDVTARANVTTLTSHLLGQSTTATQILSSLETYRFRWDPSYSPEGRFRYGFAPSQVAAVDGALAPVNHTIAKEIEPAALINDPKAGVCELALSGATEITADGSEGESLDLVSLLTLVVQSLAELDARIAILEP